MLKKPVTNRAKKSQVASQPPNEPTTNLQRKQSVRNSMADFDQLSKLLANAINEDEFDKYDTAQQPPSDKLSFGATKVVGRLNKTGIFGRHKLRVDFIETLVAEKSRFVFRTERVLVHLLLREP